MMQISPDIVAFAESPVEFPERWVLLNVFSKETLGVGPEVFSFLASLTEPMEGRFRIWRIWRFSHTDGLLADPSRFKRDAATWGDPELLSGEALLKLLKERSIIIDEISSYKNRFALKRNLLDRENYGTYHQQLGQHLIADIRTEPARWWLRQKFTPDLAQIRKDNLYGAVQGRFLDIWLPRHIFQGSRVLDIGCGAGFISRKIASLGGSVHGIDPNGSYIQMAKENATPNEEYTTLDLNSSEALDVLPDASFDVIYMSDALLFYFIPYDAGSPLNLNAFIGHLKRLLKPGGTFLSLEPHPVFYVLPWLGASDRPFTIVTEYFDSFWRINPPLSTLVKPFLSEGFVISGLEEPVCAADDLSAGERGAKFANRFPLWLMLEFKYIP